MRLVGLVAALALASHAYADGEPWKKGVTPEQMQKAQGMLDEGNTLLLERDYARALARYQDAVAVWDHPAIRFNMVRCLIQLDRIVEASENLERALAYGAAPLEDTVYNEALAYQKLLANQVGTLVVDCTQPGVEVTLDGKPVLTCPGTHTQRIVPGPHQIVGKKPDLLTRTAEIVVLGGKQEKLTLSLEPLAGRGKLTHRWSTWFPWTVLGGGVVALGGGILVQRLATSDRDDYYATLGRECESPCPEGFAQDRKDRAILENRIAIGVIGLGAAAIITGGVLLYLNRGRVVYPESEVMPAVTPVDRGATVGLSAPF